MAQRCQGDRAFALHLLLVPFGQRLRSLTLDRFGMCLSSSRSVLERTASRGSSSSRFVSSRLVSPLPSSLTPAPLSSLNPSSFFSFRSHFSSFLRTASSPLRLQSLPLSSDPPQADAPQHRRSPLEPPPGHQGTVQLLYAGSEGGVEEEVGG